MAELPPWLAKTARIASKGAFAFVTGQLFDRDYWNPGSSQRRRIEERLRDEERQYGKPLNTPQAWKEWFDKTGAGIDKLDAKGAEAIRDEMFVRVRSQKSRDALATFSTDPTPMAVDIAGRCAEFKVYPMGFQNLTKWALMRETLGKLNVSMRNGLVRMRGAGSHTQRTLDDQAAIYNATGDEGRGAFGQRMAQHVTAVTQSATLSLIPLNVGIIARQAQRMDGVSPAAAMKWLTKHTVEGQTLVDTIRTYESFDRQTGSAAGVEPAFRSLDPGVARVLRSELGLPTPSKAASDPQFAPVNYRGI